MGKNHSKFGLSSSAGKKRENPEGGTYILNGCVNGRFRNSEECVWSNAATSGSPARFTLTSPSHPSTPEKLKTCQCENELPPVGFAEDNCRFEVALPPEVTGSACSVKVIAMEDRDSICKPPLSPSNGKLPSVALDYNVSLDHESDQQEWSFTLYDFDGHRKVTREDLSSVLKSISEALSESVTLPPCGSKKLHLRLSVMPDTETAGNSLKKISTPATTPSQEKDSDGTKIVTVSKQSQSKSDPATTPNGVCEPLRAHVHRRNHHHHHHHHRRDGARSSKRHSRSQPTNQGDAGDLEVISPDKRHSRIRKHRKDKEKDIEGAATANVDLPTATEESSATIDKPKPDSNPIDSPKAHRSPIDSPKAHSNPIDAPKSHSSPIDPPESHSNAIDLPKSNSNSSKESTTPESPCTVIVNQLTAENLANHENQERKSEDNRKSDENRERRTYYQELAGIDNTCSNQEDPPEGRSPAQALKEKHERTAHERTRKKHHRNSHHFGSPTHRRSKVYEIDLPLDQLDRAARSVEKPKGTNGYQMQLLEASKAKLENQQPLVPVATPLTPPENGVETGAVVMHRKEQRRRHHNNGSKSKRPTTLQPFMLFEHEVMSTNDRPVFTSPTLHRHDHHHHHEHHHHYHYHHYHT